MARILTDAGPKVSLDDYAWFFFLLHRPLMGAIKVRFFRLICVWLLLDTSGGFLVVSIFAEFSIQQTTAVATPDDETDYAEDDDKESLGSTPLESLTAVV